MSLPGSVLGKVFVAGPLEWTYVEVFFLNAGAPVSVKHNLTGTVIGWTLVRKRDHGDIRDGPAQPSQNVLQLTSDTNQMRVLVRIEAVRIPRQ